MQHNFEPLDYKCLSIQLDDHVREQQGQAVTAAAVTVAAAVLVEMSVTVIAEKSAGTATALLMAVLGQRRCLVQRREEQEQ